MFLFCGNQGFYCARSNIFSRSLLVGPLYSKHYGSCLGMQLAYIQVCQKDITSMIAKFNIATDYVTLQPKMSTLLLCILDK